MANHSSTKLPFEIPAPAMAFLAKQAVLAAFGGLYQPDFKPDRSKHKTTQGEYSFFFSFAIQGEGDTAPKINLWSDGPKHLESRHSTHGLHRLCQDFLEQQLSCCFGARHIDDDGVGKVSPGEPGLLRIFQHRFHSDGRVDIYRKFTDPAKLPPPGQDAGNWLLSGPALDNARKLCPKFFEFTAPTDVTSEQQQYALQYLPEDARALMIAHENADTLDIRPLIHWGKSIDADFPKPLSPEIAGALLMPAAAMGLDIPSRLVKEAGADGCSKALAMAIVYRQHQASADLLDAVETEFGAPARSIAIKSALRDAKKIARQAEPEEKPHHYWNVPESISLFEKTQIEAAAPAPATTRKSKPPRV